MAIHGLSKLHINFSIICSCSVKIVRAEDLNRHFFKEDIDTVFLPGESQGQEELSGLQSMGSLRVGHD